MLTRSQSRVKRGFDVVISLILLMLFSMVILLLIILACWSTKQNGLLKQERIGKAGDVFIMYKIRTMKIVKGISTFVTVKNDPRITPLGAFLRKTKLDELPQLYNVLRGDMSLVGPRPDVSGFADKLVGEDRVILSVKPGITGPASLKYREEEKILSKQKNPEEYNTQVIWPDKVKINKEYIEKWTFMGDIKYLFKTVKN